jgi:hypothetical protein
MLARVYLPPFITALFGGLFIALGVLTFGNASLFDGLFIAVLLFAGIVCRKNINIVSLLVIIVIDRLLQELAWFGLSSNDLLKELLYILTLVVLLVVRYDPLVKIIFPIIMLVIGAEIYWYVTDYPAPQLYWYITLLLSCLVTRFMIFSRLDWVEKFFPNKSQSINLDWIFYKLIGTTSIILSAMLLEYLVRHVFNFAQVTVIYYSYPYLVHAIATFSVWATFNESYKQLQLRLIKA